jgi:hypothetical protein
LIKEKGKLLNEQFLTAKSASFHSKYVMGMKLGEGQHASVSICYERTVPRSTEECTPLLSHQIDKDAFKPIPYAVKKVSDEDEEKLIAHEKEFEIL